MSILTILKKDTILIHVYANKQVAISIKQSLGSSPSLHRFLKKNRPGKFPFYRKKQLNCISCSILCKITLRSEFPDIPDKAYRVTRR